MKGIGKLTNVITSFTRFGLVLNSPLEHVPEYRKGRLCLALRASAKTGFVTKMEKHLNTQNRCLILI